MDRKVIIKSHGSSSSSPYGSSSSSVLQHKSFEARKGWGITACLKHPSHASTQAPCLCCRAVGQGLRLFSVYTEVQSITPRKLPPAPWSQERGVVWPCW